MAVSISVEIKQNSQSVASNTSSVTVAVKLTTTEDSYNLIGAPSSITLGGNASGTTSFTSKFGKRQTTTVYSRTLTVSHNADGTARVTASATVQTGTYVGTITASTSRTLSTIPRASSVSVALQAGKALARVGDTVTINVARKSSGFTHTLRYVFGTRQSGITSEVGTSYEWTIPSVLTSYMTSSSSQICTIYCDTYSGSTKIGTTSTTLRIYIPVDANPTITAYDYEVDEGYLESFGVLLAGKRNTLTATMSASGYQGSTIETYRVELVMADGTKLGTWESSSAPTSSSPAELPLDLAMSGSGYVRFTAIDSRGRQATRSVSTTVERCYLPRVTVTAYRYDASAGAESDESTTIRIEVSGWTSDVGGEGANFGLVTVSIREKGASSWTVLSNAVNRGTAWSFALTTSNRGTSSEYEVEASVTDVVGATTTATAYVGTAKPVLDFRRGGGGLGIFAVADRDAVRIGAPLSIVHDGSLAMEDESGDSVPWVENAAQGRPTIVQHTALGNGVWLQAVANAGSKTNLLSVDDRNVTNLSWTMPEMHASTTTTWGLGGRVYKEIWSGTWSSGDITVQELPYYNLLALDFDNYDGGTASMLCARMATGKYPSHETDFFGTATIRGTDGVYSVYTSTFSVVNIGGYILRANGHRGYPVSLVRVGTNGTWYAAVKRIRGVV